MEGHEIWSDFKTQIQTGSKFATKLLAAENKNLAESGRGFYACGLTITDTNIMDKSKWSSNQLGIMLEKFRNDLHVKAWKCIYADLWFRYLDSAFHYSNGSSTI